jgi:hypothetical protein
VVTSEEVVTIEEVDVADDAEVCSADDGVLAELSWADDVEEMEGRRVCDDVTGISKDDVITMLLLSLELT